MTDEYLILPEVTDPDERKLEFKRMISSTTESLREQFPGIKLWWYCEKCDAEEDGDAWFAVSSASPLVDQNGTPRCPDCREALLPVSDDVIDNLIGPLRDD